MVTLEMTRPLLVVRTLLILRGTSFANLLWAVIVYPTCVANQKCTVSVRDRIETRRIPIWLDLLKEILVRRFTPSLAPCSAVGPAPATMTYPVFGGSPQPSNYRIAA